MIIHGKGGVIRVNRNLTTWIDLASLPLFGLRMGCVKIWSQGNVDMESCVGWEGKSGIACCSKAYWQPMKYGFPYPCGQGFLGLGAIV